MMDTTSLFLFEKIKNNSELDYLELFNFLILIPLIGMVIEYIKDNISNLKTSLGDTITWGKKIHVDLIATESTCSFYTESGIRAYYGINILALSYYIKKNKISAPIKYISNKEFVITNCNNIRIKKGLYLQVFSDEEFTGERIKDMINITYRLFSTSLSIDEIQSFIEELKKEYIILTEKDKLYHYIYEGEGKFSRQIISDLSENLSLETFDHLINEHSDNIKKDLDRLKNISYYQRTGLKRKKGYLFYGEPGCGKTSTVMAMANYDHRHIIEIPLSRIETNQEIEKILSLENLGEFDPVKKSEAIILFDELDCNVDVLNRPKTSTPENTSISTTSLSTSPLPKSSSHDKLNLGSLLSRLDGIGNYDGLVIVATTNHKDHLDPALYRELRLTPIAFDFSRKEDMIKILESFYNRRLKEKELVKIPDRNARITPAKFRFLLERYENDLPGMLSYLSTFE